MDPVTNTNTTASFGWVDGVNVGTSLMNAAGKIFSTLTQYNNAKKASQLAMQQGSVYAAGSALASQQAAAQQEQALVFGGVAVVVVLVLVLVLRKTNK